MNQILKRNKPFKAQFLYKDVDWINRKINEIQKAAKACNQAIDEVQKLFKRKLTAEEIKQIPVGKWSYVTELVKKDSDFPNAEVETLFSLLGLDPKPAKEAVNNIKGYTNDLSFENSKFIVSKETIQRTEDVGTYYTKNEAQNNALECFKTISEALNKGIDNGVIFDHESWQNRFRDKLSITKTEKGNWGFQPNHDYIWRTYKTKEN